MSYQPFLIGNYQSGVDHSQEPWLLPQNAFQTINNAYLERGVIYKRAGIQLFGKLTESPPGGATIVAFTSGAPPTFETSIAHGLSNGDQVGFYGVNGLEVDGQSQINLQYFEITVVSPTEFTIAFVGGGAIDSSSWSAYINGGTLIFVPARQVTGICKFVLNDGSKEIICTDTKRVSRFNSVTKVFDPIDSTDVFNSTNYMWFEGYGVTGDVTSNTLYLSNFADNMRSYVPAASTTSFFIPQYGSVAADDVVAKALMIFNLKNRLVLLHTFEGDVDPSVATARPQRARWSKAGDPLDRTAPYPAGATDNWREDIPGKGGFVDCPTNDVIIGAEFLKDYLIVFFSNSTWTLRPTTDPSLPFRWDKLNNFRSCDATFSTISYDRYVQSYGKTGIVACDGLDTQRIDQKIEDFTTNDVDAESFDKMYSDRNYTTRHSWTLYTPTETEGRNTKALIRSEVDGSWSYYEIELSCLGQGEAFTDFTMSDFSESTFDDLSESETFNSFYFQDEGNLFLGGDYQGSIYTLEIGDDDEGQAIPMYLLGAGWNPFKDQGIQCQLGYVDIYADVDPASQLTVRFYLDDSVDPYAEQRVNLVPEQGFVAQIQVINLTNPLGIIASSHGLSTGDQIYISGTQTEADGGAYQITVVDLDTFTLDAIDGTSFSPYSNAQGIITFYDPSEFNKVWKRAFAGGVGYTHTVEIETQGTGQNIAIQSITPWFRKAGTRMIT